MDGIEPELLRRAEHALHDTPGVVDVERLQLRWIGHRLHGNATISTDAAALTGADRVAHDAANQLWHVLPNLDAMTVTPVPAHHKARA